MPAKAVLLGVIQVFNDAAIFVVFGFFIAGLVHTLMKPQSVAKHLGGRGIRLRPVLMATLVGLPLPLCSCSVVPTALLLRKMGANKGAAIAFLTSTPETDVNSIILSYGMLGPVFAIFRPVAAFFASVVAGMATNWIGGADEPPQTGRSEQENSPSSCCEPCENDAPAPNGVIPYVRRAMHMGFVSLFGDIIPWLIGGIIVAGLISSLVPEDFLSRLPGGQFGAMLGMLAIGVPLYVCATASTPAAAAMMLKGLDPGAALVFLLAGPATNIGTLGLVSRHLGRRTALVYAGSIAISTILMGVCLNAVLGIKGSYPALLVREAQALVPQWARVAGSVCLLALIVWHYRNLRLKELIRSVRGRIREMTGINPR